MLFKKKELKIDIHKGQVQCETCKHWIDKEDAQEVKLNTFSAFYHHTTTHYYCPMHKKPYDSRVSMYGGYGISYHKKIDTSIKVDKNGKPIEKDWYKKLLK